MQVHGSNSNRAIFKTLKAVLDSNTPLTVKNIAAISGFGERMVQRHVEVLADAGIVRRVNKIKGKGFVYVRNIKFIDMRRQASPLHQGYDTGVSLKGQLPS